MIYRSLLTSINTWPRHDDHEMRHTGPLTNQIVVGGIILKLYVWGNGCLTNLTQIKLSQLSRFKCSKQHWTLQVVNHKTNFLLFLQVFEATLAAQYDTAPHSIMCMYCFGLNIHQFLCFLSQHFKIIILIKSTQRSPQAKSWLDFE